MLPNRRFASAGRNLAEQVGQPDLLHLTAPRYTLLLYYTIPGLKRDIGTEYIRRPARFESR